jgi:hypothetical protein
MKAQIGLNLVPCRGLLPKLMIDPSHSHMGLCIEGIQSRRFTHFRDSLFRLFELLQNRTQLKMCLRKLRIEPNRLTQVRFRFGDLVQKSWTSKWVRLNQLTTTVAARGS